MAWTHIIYSVNKINILLTMNNTDTINKMWFSVIITIYAHNLGLFIIKIELMTTKKVAETLYINNGVVCDSLTHS